MLEQNWILVFQSGFDTGLFARGGRGEGGGGRGGDISWICYRIFCWCDGEIDCMVV